MSWLRTPVGFPSYTHHIRRCSCPVCARVLAYSCRRSCCYCPRCCRDWLARKAFEKSEVNTRVYKARIRSSASLCHNFAGMLAGNLRKHGCQR